MFKRAPTNRRARRVALPAATDHTILYGATAIAYTLRRSRRKTLGIRIRPDASVQVTAPLGAAQGTIEEVLRRKAPWIVRKQGEVRARQEAAPALRYVSGETHFYLGRPYVLAITHGPKVRVGLGGASLCVQAPDPHNAAAVAAAIERWQKQAAARVFADVMAAAAARVQPLGIVAPPALRMRRMKTRWGSCTAKGVITLNLRLIQVDVALIEYVVVHELCHLREHNHSPAYYRLLDQALPEWRARKRQLNGLRLP
jgi:predicted metal-dependent hydrolase